MKRPLTVLALLATVLAGSAAMPSHAQRSAPDGNPLAPIIAEIERSGETHRWQTDLPSLAGSFATQNLHTALLCDAMDVETVRVVYPPSRPGVGDSIIRLLPRAKSPGEPGIPDVGRQALRYNRHSGIHYAVTRATRSTGALLLSVRPPIQRELDMMQAKGVELEVTPIARDALVFGLSRENPVDGLTLEQIQAIYGGNVARWDEVGGPAERIRVYRQDNTSGPHGLMRELVMNRRFMVDARELRRGSLDTLLDDTWGIGYSVFYQMDSMTPHAGIKLAEINGVAPTMATIRSGEYPLCSEILAIIRVDEPAESIVRRTLDWLLTDDGQKVVADAGYIPLDPGVAGQ